MRIDKLLTTMGLATRSETSKAVRKGQVKVNGCVISKSDHKVDPEKDTIEYMGKPVLYMKNIYIMLNKPSGIVSSTDGKDGVTVISLLPDELQKCGLFPCGRLDKDTLGFLLLTNDGSTAHYLLSPKRHVSKVYYVKTQSPVSDSDIKMLENGVTLDHGDVALPAKVEKVCDTELKITIVEGMYHQIKRMLEAVNNKVIYLERIEFGTLPLDTSLKRGEWRYLTEQEIDVLMKQTK
ncbi:MAG: rRNA pseudouridine synthase [Ruminococcaceae bacterium]|nr:rRNA pseudouridine synthase [Oscillospiraceae bacterium]